MVDINLTIIIQLVNFLVLVFILKKVLWNPLMKHIDRRDALIAGRKEEIEKLKAESQRMRDEYNERIRAARRDGTLLQSKLIREGRIERLNLMAAAMDESDRLVSEGEKRLLAEKQTALLGVKDEEIASIADQIVSKTLPKGNKEAIDGK